MATNLVLDDDLIKRAVEIGNHGSKREAVNTALREYVRSFRRAAAVAAMGSEDPGEVADPPPRKPATAKATKTAKATPRKRAAKEAA